MGEKKVKKAAALSYNIREDMAPKVVAKGKGYVAEAIIDKAEAAQIPVYQDEKLADQLNQLSVGADIPEHLYDVVAQVLIFIAKIDGKGR